MKIILTRTFSVWFFFHLNFRQVDTCQWSHTIAYTRTHTHTSQTHAQSHIHLPTQLTISGRVQHSNFIFFRSLPSALWLFIARWMTVAAFVASTSDKSDWNRLVVVALHIFESLPWTAEPHRTRRVRFSHWSILLLLLWLVDCFGIRGETILSGKRFWVRHTQRAPKRVLHIISQLKILEIIETRVEQTNQHARACSYTWLVFIHVFVIHCICTACKTLALNPY